MTVFVLLTPQGDVLDVAHGAFSAISWPQPYLCTTLVHMLAVLWERGRHGRTAGGRRLLQRRGRKARRRAGEGREGGGGRREVLIGRGWWRGVAWCRRLLWQLETETAMRSAARREGAGTDNEQRRRRAAARAATATEATAGPRAAKAACGREQAAGQGVGE